jgi:dGTPase
MADNLLNTTVAVIDSLGVRGPDDVRDARRRCVGFSPQMARDIEEMQDFLLNNVYLSERHAELDQRGQRIIRELFNAFVATPSLLPERYRRRIESDGLCRVTCDYIAGMTDRYCQQEHARLLG